MATNLATPYYEHGGITIYHGDCRDVLGDLGPVSSVVTDPVWPNRPADLFPHVAAGPLLRETLTLIDAERIVIQVGCDTDPRFLDAVPGRWPFLRVCWLRYACPSYKGRILNTGDIGYVFGVPAPSAPGAHCYPGEILATKKDVGFTRWNASGQVKRGGLDASLMPHPTPRKLAHVSWLVKWFGGDLILDPFAGSGTTLRAAKDNGRHAIGIEIEERYCEIAAKRLSQEVLDLGGAA